MPTIAVHAVDEHLLHNADYLGSIFKSFRQIITNLGVMPQLMLCVV